MENQIQLANNIIPSLWEFILQSLLFVNAKDKHRFSFQ